MIKKIHLNPILKKEMQVGSRSIKMSWGIFGLNALLSLIVLFFMSALESNAMYSSYEYESLAALFPILGTIECVVLSLLIPVITSSSISGERERQTLDIMLTTPVRPFSIAIGKLGSTLLIVMMYMVSSIPTMSVAFVLGGLSWSALPGLLVMMLYIGVYVGSLGICCSSVVKKSVSATVLTIVFEALVVILTLVAFGVLWYAKQKAALPASTHVTYEALVLMLNPYSAFVDFMLRVITTGSIYRVISASGQLPGILDVLYRYWIPVSMALNLAVSYVFLRIASRNIRVNRIRRGRKKKKKANASAEP